MKVCRKCGALKVLDQFGKHNRNNDGRQSYCRACDAVRHRVSRAVDPEKVREYERSRQRNHRAANPEKVREYDRAYQRRRNGTPLDQPRQIQASGDDVGNVAVHQRLVALYGPASAHDCDCGSQAAQWAYSNVCPDEKQHERGPYCVHTDCYEPLCRSCHKIRDNAVFTLEDLIRDAVGAFA